VQENINRLKNKIENVVELNEYKFNNMCNEVLMKYLQIQSLIKIIDKLMRFVRENALMRFMRERTVKRKH
jgi:hypothetical protein